MADKITAQVSSTGPRVPEGEYQGVCVDVVDMGEILNEKWSSLQHKAALVFQLEDPRNPAKRFEIAERFTVSMGDKARLRKFLEQWRGRPYKVEEVKNGVPLDKLEGNNAMVTVVHNESGERTFANIHLIRPLDKGRKPIKAHQYSRDEYWDEHTKRAEDQRRAREAHAEVPVGTDDDGLPLEEDDLPF